MHQNLPKCKTKQKYSSLHILLHTYSFKGKKTRTTKVETDENFSRKTKFIQKKIIKL